MGNEATTERQEEGAWRRAIAVSGEDGLASGKEGRRNWWLREGILKVYFFIKLTE